MYIPSIDYTDYIAQSRIRKPKSKIIVDGTEYTGETAIKTYPKISHFTSDVLGVFPSKTCEFEIYNKDGNLNLNGKEVAVYRGLDIDGTIEWIPMGLFSGKNEDIVSNSTSKTISFKGYDRTIMFDVPFNPLNHTYPCTLGDFAKQLCKNHAIPLETESFPLSDLILNQAPAVTSNVTERELISRIAELGGCIAQISRSGGLRITKPVESSITVLQGKYKSFSYENQQIITKVVIGQTDNEDTSQTADSEVIGTYGTFIRRIDDNPYIFDRQSEVISSVATEIIGLQTRAFVLNDFIDDFIFDLNDIITVKDKNGNETKVILRSLQTQSRIKSNFSADSIAESSAEATALAGSQKQVAAQQKAESKKFEEQLKQATQDMAVNMNKALGLYSSEIYQEDGSKTVYFHDKSNLETSTYIFTANAEGFAWVSGSGCWNGGIPQWQYGIDSAGGGILSTLLVRDLTANVIKTGVLKSANSPNTSYNLDTGEFKSVAEETESVIDGITGNTVSRTTRWESTYINGVFSMKTYVNDILLTTVITDHNGTTYDQSFLDSLSDDEEKALTIPLKYYEFDATFRPIYESSYKFIKAVTGYFGKSGFFNIKGGNENTYTSLGLKSLWFNNQEGIAAMYGDSEARVNTVQALENLIVRGNNVNDFVVEQGSSGIWTYRKWASGIAECWGVAEVNTTIQTAFGSIFRGEDTYFYDFPFSFSSPPQCAVDVEANYTCWVATGGKISTTTTHTRGVLLFRSYAVTDNVAAKLIFTIHGKWK